MWQQHLATASLQHSLLTFMTWCCAARAYLDQMKSAHGDDSDEDDNLAAGTDVLADKLKADAMEVCE